MLGALLPPGPFNELLLRKGFVDMRFQSSHVLELRMSAHVDFAGQTERSGFLLSNSGGLDLGLVLWTLAWISRYTERSRPAEKSLVGAPGAPRYILRLDCVPVGGASSA